MKNNEKQTTKKANANKQATAAQNTAKAKASAAEKNGGKVTDTITAENIFSIARAVAIKCIKTNLCGGTAKPSNAEEIAKPIAAQRAAGNKHITAPAVEYKDKDGKEKRVQIATNSGDVMRKLLNGLYHDLKCIDCGINEPFSDGIDLLNTVYLYLFEHIGEKLNAPLTPVKIDKKGNPVTIMRGAFRAANKHISAYRAAAAREKMLDVCDYNGVAVTIDKREKITDIYSAVIVKNIIKAAHLSRRQMQIFSLKWIGRDGGRIAKTLDINKSAYKYHNSNMQKKFCGENVKKTVLKLAKFTKNSGKISLYRALDLLAFYNKLLKLAKQRGLKVTKK